MGILRWILRFTLVPFIAPFTVFIEMVALYFLVTKICELDRRRTLRICYWYVGILFSISLLMHILIH